MKVKELAVGSIVWYKDLIVGVVGIHIDEQYAECDTKPVDGNPYDYDLIPVSPKMEEDLERKRLEDEEEEGDE